MKKFILSLSLLLLILTSNAQRGTLPHSWSSDFSLGRPIGGFYSLDEGADPNEFLFNIVLEELQVIYDKTSWHFMHWSDYDGPLRVRPGIIYLKDNPIIEFDFHTVTGVSLTLQVQGLGSTTTIAETKIVPASPNFQHLIFDFSSNIGTLNDTITELKFMFNDMQNTVYFDNFKMGDCTNPAFIEPSLNYIEDIEVPKNLTKQITLVGITDGGAGKDISIEALAQNSVDNMLLQPPTVTYTSPDTFAILKIQPIGTDTGQVDVLVRVSTTDGIFEKVFNVNVIEEDTTQQVGVNENHLINLYPNPAKEILHVTLTNGSYNNLIIFNSAGQEMIRQRIVSNIIDIHTTSLNPGLYFLSIDGKKNNFQSKFLIE